MVAEEVVQAFSTYLDNSGFLKGRVVYPVHTVEKCSQHILKYRLTHCVGIDPHCSLTHTDRCSLRGHWCRCLHWGMGIPPHTRWCPPDSCPPQNLWICRNNERFVFVIKTKKANEKSTKIGIQNWSYRNFSSRKYLANRGLALLIPFLYPIVFVKTQILVKNIQKFMRNKQKLKAFDKKYLFKCLMYWNHWVQNQEYKKLKWN